MGLTQVIPSTADGIAAKLEVEDFRYTDLFRPRTSLRFGAHYLGGLIEGFGGEIPVALAGYNGGPGNAAYWWELGGGGHRPLPGVYRIPGNPRSRRTGHGELRAVPVRVRVLASAFVAAVACAGCQIGVCTDRACVPRALSPVT